VNALLAATHDQPADASSLPSQLLTIEVLQRPLDFAESWVVGVVPWLLLIYLTATQGPYRTFYQTGTGRLVVLAAGIWWAIGLFVLRVLKKQVAEPRVLGAAAEEGAT